MYVACFWHFFIVSQMDSVCGSGSRKEKLAANDHFNVYFLLNNSRQDKCWMAYRDSLPLKIAWWNYLFLSFACWTVCPVSALVQWKGIFLHNLWSIFLFRIIWYEPIFFLGEILNHLGLAVVSGLELKKLKDAASRDNFFLHETIKRFSTILGNSNGYDLQFKSFSSPPEGIIHKV